MVNRLSFIPVIGLLFLMCSCDFFFRTPFPQDLVYFDKANDLRSAIPVIPQEYSLSTLGEIGILRGYYDTFDHSWGLLIVFDSNLHILFNHDANVGKMEMIDANGDYIIGDQNFGSLSEMASSTPISAKITATSNSDGFSAGGNNIAITQTSDTLYDVTVYDGNWNSPATWNIDFVPQYRLRSIRFSPADMTNPNIVYFFLENSFNSSQIYEIAVNATELYPVPSPSPLPIILPDASHPAVFLESDYGLQYVFFTKKGFVSRDGNGNYRLYSRSDGSVINQKRIDIQNNKNYYEAIDVSGNHRYIFNSKNWMLYHSRFWW
jgi:hypothetical protein